MQDWKEKLKVVTNINFNTDRWVEIATDTVKTQSTNLQAFMGSMA